MEAIIDNQLRVRRSMIYPKIGWGIHICYLEKGFMKSFSYASYLSIYLSIYQILSVPIYLSIYPQVGDIVLSLYLKTPENFCAFNFPERIVGCALTFCSYGQI